MAKRCSNGEGSYWHWVHQITLNRKEDGSFIRKSFKGRTKVICKERKEEWLAEQAALKEKAEAEAQETAREQDEEIRRGHSLKSDAQGKYKLPCNPTLSTIRPEVVQREMRVLSPDEMQIFIEEVMKET